MESNFPFVSLSGLAEISTGKSNTQDALAIGEYPFFDRSQIIKRSNKYLFNCEAVIVPGEGKEFIPRYYRGKFDLHQRAYAVVPNERVDGVFLYYAMMQCKNHFSRIAVGSTVKSLRLASFETMLVPLPSMDTQRKIAYLLNLIDLLINTNRRANDYLAAVGQELFERYLDLCDLRRGNIGVLGDIAEGNPKRVLRKGARAKCVDMSSLSSSSPFPNGWIEKEYGGGMRFANGDTLIARITPCLENGKTAFVIVSRKLV